jgi:hypothetical protein
MREVRVLGEAEQPAAGTCWCAWRAGVPCPHAVEWCVINTTNDGDSLMCGPHQAGVAAAYPEALVQYVPVMGGETRRS